jgi:hypothetical protein
MTERVHFTDITAAAGIHFTHNAGRSGKKWLPETMGPGCAFFDADGDGWLDILLINGKDLVPKGRRTTAALYRNNRDGTFTDITKGSGLDVELYGIGVSIGDYDNDVSQRRQRTFQRRHARIRLDQLRLRFQRHLVRLRSRRQTRPVRRQLCAMDAAGRSVVFARWFHQVLLHAGIV